MSKLKQFLYKLWVCTILSILVILVAYIFILVGI